MTLVVEIRGLRKAFGSVAAVDGIDLAIEQGKALSLLGSSGCGKTTTLRCIAGLEQPDSGEILIDGELVASPARRIAIPSAKRGLGMVFQSYAIWPHMTVFDNIAYGLQTRSISANEQKRRVRRVLEQTNLIGLERRYPAQLSGGQQQRVALARAIVYEPKVLLMDEPLSNLDARLREQTRIELRQIQAQLGITTIYVTHDQQEALTMSDEIAVMQFGRILQIGPPEEIYSRPAHRFVAEFVGKSDLLPGIVEERDGGLGRIRLQGVAASSTFRCPIAPAFKPGDHVLVVVRPEQWQISPHGDRLGENQLDGEIMRRVFLGNYIEYSVKADGLSLVVQAPPHIRLTEGTIVSLKVDPQSVVLLLAEGSSAVDEPISDRDSVLVPN